MHAPGRPVWFVGDLDDPWVAALAAALPDDATRLACAGPWPEDLFAGLPAAATLILHRTVLVAADAERLARLRTPGASTPRVVLCVGPHPRHAELERWLPLVDAVLPEATARETIARHLGDGKGGVVLRPAGSWPRLAVVSADYELRSALADACAAAGYAADTFADWPETAAGTLAIWDVPVLEAGWARTLARRSQLVRVVALLGFADRAMVAEARAQGASACLELPCDLADLVFVLDRLATTRAEPGHDVPPPPAVARRPKRAVAGPARDPYN